MGVPLTENKWMSNGLSAAALEVLNEGLRIGRVEVEPFLTGCRGISAVCREDSDWDFATYMPDPPACRKEFVAAGWTYKFIRTRDRGATIYKRASDGSLVNLIAIPDWDEYTKWWEATTSGFDLGLRNRDERVAHFRDVVGERSFTGRVYAAMKEGQGVEDLPTDDAVPGGSVFPDDVTFQDGPGGTLED